MRQQAIALGLALVISVGKLVVWWPLDKEQGALRRALAQLPRGSTLAVVDLRNGGMPQDLLTPHAAGWAVVDRSVLLSSLFARPFGPFDLAPEKRSSWLMMESETGATR